MKELLIRLQTGSKVPLYEQIYRYIKEEITSGRMKAGEGVPSSRSLARQLQISRSTATMAYEQLVSEGYLEAREYKGFFVCDIAGLAHIPRMADAGEEPGRRACAGKSRFDFAVNGIAKEGFPVANWIKLMRGSFSEDETAWYTLPDGRGEEGIRREIAAYLHYARGVSVVPSQIVIGAGNDYLLMLLSLLLGKEKVVAMEDPTYISAYRCFLTLGHRVEAIPVDTYGMCAEALGASKADVAYIMPSHQFPTGSVMPVGRRMQLLSWAYQEEGRFLIEDDYDSEFRYRGKPIPAMQGLDKNGRVIYLGTFSKSLTPSLRISYMVLPPSLLGVYDERGRCFPCTVSGMDQKVVEAFLREGYFERHLNHMRAVYKEKHDVLLHALRPLLCICHVEGEHSGVHVLLVFSAAFSEEELVEKAKKKGVKVYPLSDYCIRMKPKTACILLGYATLRVSEIREAASALIDAWL